MVSDKFAYYLLDFLFQNRIFPDTSNFSFPSATWMSFRFFHSGRQAAKKLLSGSVKAPQNGSQRLSFAVVAARIFWYGAMMYSVIFPCIFFWTDGYFMQKPRSFMPSRVPTFFCGKS